MPDFLPPKVVGELSTLNTYVVVENHQPGTTIKIWADETTLIGTKTGATGGRDQVSINPSFLPLTGGTSLTATQEDSDGFPSKRSPVPVIVQVVPNPLNRVRFEGTVYSCVDFLRASGLTPGAKFEVHQPSASGGSGAPIGQGETYNGSADIVLNQTVDNVNPLILRQIANSLTSDALYPMPIIAAPMASDRKLPQLTVKEALDCGWYIDVTGTIAGIRARIKRGRNGTTTDFFGYGGDVQTRFWTPEPFRAGDITVADQEMRRDCKVQPSDPSKTYEVELRTIHPPLIDPPVCLDAEEIELLNIEPGAEYAVYAIFNTTSGEKQRLIGRGQFPVKEPDRTIPINRVEADPTQLPGTVPSLVINQTACGWTSSLSPPVAMEHLGVPTTPKLPDQLLSCAVYVRVANVRAGSWVSVHSKLRGGTLSGPPEDWLGGRIGRTKAKGIEVSVYVPYGLIEGDTVWACETGCQDKPSHSDPASVESSGRALLQPHLLEPVYPSDRTIRVQKLVTGARIFTRVLGPKHPGGQKLYTMYAWAPECEVYVGDLYEKDQITVFQGLCDSNFTKNQSKTATVILGTMAISIAPVSSIWGTTRDFSVQAKDPSRGDALISGDVLINGVHVGSTTANFAWTAPTSGSAAAVQVNAAGYMPWSGSITLMRPQGTVPNPVPVVVGGSGGSGGSSGKNASYWYTCEPVTGGVKFKINGANFPTTPNTQVTIMPQFNGNFTAFGITRTCGEDAQAGTNGPFGPFSVDAAGKFEVTVGPVRFGCQSTCAVSLLLSCNRLLPSQITHPGGPYCNCG